MVNSQRVSDGPSELGAGRGDIAAKRFKAALSSLADTQPGGAGGLPLLDGDRDGCAARHPRASIVPEEPPLPPGLHELWNELVMTLDAAQRLSSSHWRLRLRLDPQAFPDTALLLACRAGDLVFTVRTASAPVHTRLRTHWLELETRLRQQARTVDAALQYVPLEELDL